MSRWKPKRATSNPLYHTYLMGDGWTFYILDVIPRSAHGPFMTVFHEAVAEGDRQTITMPDTPWGELIMSVYPDPRTVYVETKAQYEWFLRQVSRGGGRVN